MRVRLITIPISHYCEKARWALERARVPYQEEPHLQIFHYAATLRAGGGVTAPVLVYPGGVLSDSSDIMRWVDARHRCTPRLYPDRWRERILELEAHWDKRLGVSGRLWMYHQTLQQPDVLLQYASYGTPGWQKRGLRALFPVAKRFVEWRLSIDTQAAIEARHEVIRIFDATAQLLADGRPFLMGDAFSAADITFASLAAPLIIPAEYGVPLPTVDELPPSYSMQVKALREHPAGSFAVRMFREQRRR